MPGTKRKQNSNKFSLYNNIINRNINKNKPPTTSYGRHLSTNNIIRKGRTLKNRRNKNKANFKKIPIKS